MLFAIIQVVAVTSYSYDSIILVPDILEFKMKVSHTGSLS